MLPFGLRSAPKLFNAVADALDRAGRSFLQRMLDLLHTLPMHPLKPHPVHLNREFRLDLAWWCIFFEQWNGISFLAPPGTSSDSAAGVRCLRHMELWCMAWLLLVPGAVGPTSGCAADNSERAYPHYARLRGLGATMAQASRTMPLRQPGSGSSSLFMYLQE